MRLKNLLQAGEDSPRAQFSVCGCDACAGKTGLAEGKDPTPRAPNEAPPEGEVLVGGSYNGVIDPANDIDTLTIDVVAGETYVVVLRGSGDEPVSDTLLTVYNASGAQIGVDDDGGEGSFSTFTFTATSTGEYTIDVASFSDPEQPAAGGEYTVSVAQAGADAVPNTFGQAVAVEVGDTTIGFIETSGDGDLYAIELEAGKTYTFELAGGADYNSPKDPLTGELDTILTLYGANQAQLATNNDIAGKDDRSSNFNFTAETSGTYYLRAQAAAGDTGGYSLTAQEVDFSQLDILDSIDWGGQVIATPTEIQVYFAPDDDQVGGVSSRGWNPYEQQQAMLALEQYENVANVNFVITTNKDEAEFQLATVRSFFYLGRMSPPDEPNAGVGEFAQNGEGWDEDGSGGLEQGGYGFITMIHEFGHGMGMAHPHDNGGGSDVMFGVSGAFGDYGAFDLNQGVYTIMSYNDGWQLHPDGAPPNNDFGYQGTLMALDIAMIQEKYGANTSFNASNTVYTLPDANESGTFWSSIWDAGGKDSIVHNGAGNAVIDLRAATIDYSPTGGGLISWVDGIFGGYTIAQNVVIENAQGGSGDDVITGNEAKNQLNGGSGDDTITGGARGDKLSGDAGLDVFVFDDGDSFGTKGGTRDQIRGFVDGQDIIDVSGIDAIAGGGDNAFTFITGAFTGAGQIRVTVSGGDTLIEGNTDTDADIDFAVVLRGSFALDGADFVL